MVETVRHSVAIRRRSRRSDSMRSTLQRIYFAKFALERVPSFQYHREVMNSETDLFFPEVAIARAQSPAREARALPNPLQVHFLICSGNGHCAQSELSCMQKSS